MITTKTGIVIGCKYDPWYVYHNEDQDWIKYLINWGWYD